MTLTTCLLVRVCVRSSLFLGYIVLIFLVSCRLSFFGPCRLHLIDQAGLGHLHFLVKVVFMFWVRSPSFFGLGHLHFLVRLMSFFRLGRLYFLG